MFPLHEEPQNAPTTQQQPQPQQQSQPSPPLLEHDSSQDQPLLINSPSQKARKNKSVTKKIMKTPCDHKFHIPCLKKWLNIKLECPTCRKVIPSLE